MFALRKALWVISLFTASATAMAGSTDARLVPGERYYDELMALLARDFTVADSIDILQFNFFSENGVVRQIADRLKAIKSAHPALRIRIGVEGEKDADRPRGAAARNKVTREYFAGTGIEFYLITGIRDGETRGGG